MSKSNDWLVAGINNPDFTVQDFADAGLDTSNTQLLSKDEYLKSDFIKSKFTGDDGKFKQSEFDNFYNNRAQQYKVLQDTDQKFNYDYFDVEAKPGDKIKSPGLSLYKVANPDRLSVGISGMNQMGERKMSRMELAQSQKIYDPATGKFEDKSVNDLALTNDIVGWAKSLFDEPLVIAQWEDEGDHYDPFTRQMVHHRKGDYKLNENGTYYTERLNGRSPLNKEVVSAFDYLTVDGVGVNKYDFFDSDDIEKSVGGVIMKSAATIAPMFLTGPAGLIYGGALAAKEFSKAMPMLHNMVGAWFDAKTPGWLNNLAGHGMALSQGQSEASKGSIWNFEQMSNLITDVALQWAQQKAIAQACNYFNSETKAVGKAYEKAQQSYTNGAINMLQDPNISAKDFERLTGVSEDVFTKARSLVGNDPNRFLQPEGLTTIFEELGNVVKSGKWTETAIGKGAVTKFVKPAEEVAQKAAKVGQDLSLVYMSIISNTDLYQEMLDKGLSKKEAAIVALGSCIGMFSIDKSGLGEVFFDEATRDDTIRAFNAIRRNSDEWGDFIKQTTKATEGTYGTNRVRKLFNSAVDFSKRHADSWWHDVKYHTGGFIGKSIAEGVEEVGEDVASDCAKYIYELAGDLGFDTTVKDVGAFDDMADRYLQSFVGGALGGGLFYGVDAYKGGFTRKDLNQSMAYLIRNGRKNELLSELNKAYRKGKLGNTSLSATETTEITNDKDEKETVFLTAKEGQSQNDFIYNKIKENIEQLDAIINENQVGLNEEQLFQQMILSDLRFQKLDDALQKQTGKSLKDYSYVTGYQQHFQDICNRLIEAEQLLQQASDSETGLPGGPEKKDDFERDLQNANPAQFKIREGNIARFQQAVDALKQQKDEFLTGKLSLDYTRMLKFSMDEKLNSPFFSGNLRQYVQNTQHRDLEDLTKAELKAVTEEWNKVKGNLKLSLSDAWESYKKYENAWMNDAIALQEEQENLKASNDIIDKFFSEDGPLTNIQFVSEENGLTTAELEAFPEMTDQQVLQTVNNMSDEEYFQRFNIQKSERSDIFKRHNIDRWEEVKTAIEQLKQQLGGNLDFTTKELLRMFLAKRFKDARRELIDLMSSGFEEKTHTTADLGDLKTTIRKTIYDGFMQGASADQIKSSVEQLLNGFEQYTNLGAFKQYLTQMDMDRPLHNADDVYEYLNEKSSDKIDLWFIDGTAKSSEFLPEDIALSAEVERYINECATFDDFIAKQDGDLEENVRNALIETAAKYRHAAVQQVIDDIIEGFRNDIKVINFDAELDSKTEYYIRDILEGTADNDAYSKEALASILNETSEEAEEAGDDMYNNDLESFNNFIQYIADGLEESPVLQSIQLVHDSFKGDKSPTLRLLEKFALKVNGEDVVISSLLQKLEERYEQLDSATDFQFTPDEIEAFNDLEDIIKKFQAVVYAASTQANLINPTGHNSEINQFVANHSGIFDNFKELPVLSPDVANALITDTNKLLTTIGIKQPNGRYNFGSWRSLAEINHADKAAQLKKAQQAWNYNAGKFIDALPEALKDCELNGRKLNFTEGFSKLSPITKNDEDGDVGLAARFSLLRNNFRREFEQSGLSIKEFVHQSGIVQAVFGDDSKLGKQQASTIDQNLDALTDYDQFMLIITALSMDQKSFSKFMRQRVDDEDGQVPLTIQTWVTQQVIANKNDQSIFEAFVEEADNLYDIHDVSYRSPLTCVVFAQGDGGSGKTSVVAKHVVMYAKQLLKQANQNITDEEIDNKVWLVAPKVSQQNNLKESCGIGTRMDLFHNDSGAALFDKIFDDPSIVNEIINGATQHVSNKYVTVEKKDQEGDVIYIAKLTDEAIQHIINNQSSAPSQIIIDEATNIPPVLVEALNQYAKKNRTKENKLQILCVGDIKQLGSNVCGNNFDPDTTFCVRTNELGITMRDSNTQQAFNVKACGNCVNVFNKSDDDRNALRAALESLKNLKLKSYQGSVLNGTTIVKQLDEGLIEKIPTTNENGGKTSIVYIGSASDPEFIQLKGMGYDINVMTLEDVQGLEGDYVICKGLDVVNGKVALNKFYTALTRGKTGSIFISNSLQDYLGPLDVEQHQAFAPSIKDAIDLFKPSCIKQLDQIITDQDDANNTSFEFTTLVSGSVNPPASSTQSSTTPSNPPTTNTTTPTPSSTAPNPSTPAGNTTSTPTSITVQAPTTPTAIPTATAEEQQWNENDGKEDDDSEDQEEKVSEALATDDEAIDSYAADNEIPDVDYINYTGIGYSGMISTGLKYDGQNKTLTVIKPDDNTVVAVGMGIFLKPDVAYASNSDEIINAQELMLNMVDLIAYNHSFYDKSNVIEKICNAFGGNLSKTSDGKYKEIRFYAELQDPNEIDFVYGTGTSEVHDYNGKALMVYAYIETDRGVWKLPMGMLSHPDTEKETAEKRKVKLVKWRGDVEERTDITQDVKEKALDRIDKIINSIPVQLNKHKNFLDKLSANGGKLRINIKSSGRTWISKMKGQQMRFGSLKKQYLESLKNKLEYFREIYNKDTSNQVAANRIEWLENRIKQIEAISTDSYRAKSPQIKFSKPYVCTRESGAVKTKYIKGKRAVVFCTADSTVSDDDLLDLYSQQLEDAKQALEYNGFNVFGDKYKGVTMLPLNNLGLDIRSLVDPDLSSMFMSDDSGTYKPYETDYEGLRIFTGLWNFRANLLIFRNRVKEALTQYYRNTGRSYTLEYLQSQLDKQADWLRLRDDSIEKKYDHELIQFINQQLNKSNTIQFRLEGSTNGNGFHLGEIHLDGNQESVEKYYPSIKDGHIIGTYIDLNCCSKFLSLLGDYDNETKGKGIFGCLSTILQLRTSKDSSSELLDPTFRLTKNPYNARGIVSHLAEGLAGKGTVAYNIKYADNDGVEHEQEINFSLTNPDNTSTTEVDLHAVKFIPAMVFKIMQTSVKLLDIAGVDSVEQLDPNVKNLNQLGQTRVIYKIGDEQHEVSIWDSIAQPLIEYVKTSAQARTKPDYNWGFAPLDMIGLALHGTVESIYDGTMSSPILDSQTNKNTPLKDSSAMFPNGLFVDPITSASAKVEGDMFKRVNTNEWLFGADGWVRRPIFEYTEYEEIKYESPVEQQTITVEQAQDIQEDLSYAKVRWASEKESMNCPGLTPKSKLLFSIRGKLANDSIEISSVVCAEGKGQAVMDDGTELQFTYSENSLEWELVNIENITVTKYGTKTTTPEVPSVQVQSTDSVSLEEAIVVELEKIGKSDIVVSQEFKDFMDAYNEGSNPVRSLFDNIDDNCSLYSKDKKALKRILQNMLNASGQCM